MFTLTSKLLQASDRRCDWTPFRRRDRRMLCADGLGLRALHAECKAIGRRAALESLVSGLAALTATNGVVAQDPTGAIKSGETWAASWDFSFTRMPTAVRGGEDYATVVAAADRGPLHFAARVNCKSVRARPALVGRNFSGGETALADKAASGRRVRRRACFRSRRGSARGMAPARLLQQGGISPR
jgi:hypothetical protein